MTIMLSVQIAYSIPVGSNRASGLIALWNGRGDDVAWTLHPQEGMASRFCLGHMTMRKHVFSAQESTKVFEVKGIPGLPPPMCN